MEGGGGGDDGRGAGVVIEVSESSSNRQVEGRVSTRTVSRSPVR